MSDSIQGILAIIQFKTIRLLPHVRLNSGITCYHSVQNYSSLTSCPTQFREYLLPFSSKLFVSHLMSDLIQGILATIQSKTIRLSPHFRLNSGKTYYHSVQNYSSLISCPTQFREYLLPFSSKLFVSHLMSDSIQGILTTSQFKTIRLSPHARLNSGKTYHHSVQNYSSLTSCPTQFREYLLPFSSKLFVSHLMTDSIQGILATIQFNMEMRCFKCRRDILFYEGTSSYLQAGSWSISEQDRGKKNHQLRREVDSYSSPSNLTRQAIHNSHKWQ
jgi:hypothetical protein